MRDIERAGKRGETVATVRVRHLLEIIADQLELGVARARVDEIVEKLNAALKVALQDQNVIDSLADLGTAPVPQDRATPEAHTQLLTEQIELWAPIIEASGVTAG